MALTKVSYSMIDGASVNILDFGAVGDGVVDDTAAIQAALNSIGAQGGTVYFPRGTYKTTAPLNVKTRTTVLGEDRNATFIRAGAAMAYMLGYVWTGAGFFNVRVKHIGISAEDRTDVDRVLSFDASAGPQGAGAAHLIIEDISAGSAPNGIGVYIVNQTYAHISDLYTNNCEQGVYAERMNSSKFDCGVWYDHSDANLYIKDSGQNTFDKIELYNQDVPGNYLAVVDACGSIRLVRCAFEPVLLDGVGSVTASLLFRDSVVGADLNCTDNTVDTCDFTGTAGTQVNAIQIGLATGPEIVYKTLINNCRFITNGASYAAANADIAVVGTSRLVTVRDSKNLLTYRNANYLPPKISNANPASFPVVRQDILSGVNSGSADVSSGSVCIGLDAGATNTSAQITAVGVNTLAVTTVENSGFGAEVLADCTTGFWNTGVGQYALRHLITGETNTAIGKDALSFDTAGADMTGYDNCSGLGYNTRVSGDNQVQLGDSATTTYAFGAVQNRSDARDKADVRDTVLGLDFITQLRPVDFKWDYRDDYFEECEIDTGKVDEDNNPILEKSIRPIPKDGSKKRSRYHHGLIAQEIKAVLDNAGVDFGGLQDHNVKGGNDVLSVGYEELIAPLIKAVQELAAEVAALKAK
jgi:hypothetical protein